MATADTLMTPTHAVQGACVMPASFTHRRAPRDIATSGHPGGKPISPGLTLQDYNTVFRHRRHQSNDLRGNDKSPGAARKHSNRHPRSVSGLMARDRVCGKLQKYISLNTNYFLINNFIYSVNRAYCILKL